VNTTHSPEHAFAVFDHLPSASLEDLQSLADLQTRFDRKYVAPASVLEPLAAALDERVRVLEVDGRREFTYDTWYVDTPDLQTYRDHVQGRRRRFKLRSRTYVEQAVSMLEVKLKGLRGRTVKHRVTHPDDDPTRVGTEMQAFFDAVLREEYGVSSPTPLEPSARTWYVRMTLADLELGERITIDRGFEVLAPGRRVVFDPGMVMIEVKSPTFRGGAISLLRQLGLQPVVLSKYGVAVTTLFDEPRGNRWLPVIRELDPRMTRMTPWT
jgi:hypothetical protein